MCSAKRAHDDLERICLQTQVPRQVATRVQRAAARLVAERTAQQGLRQLHTEREIVVEREMLLTKAFAAGEVAPEDYRRTAEALRAARSRCDAALASRSADPKVLMAKVIERLEIATTLWDLYQQFDESRRIELLRTVFSSVVLSGEGIVGHALRSPFDTVSQKDASSAATAEAAAALLDAA